MDSLRRAIIAATLTFAASAVGMALQHIVPETALADAKPAVGAITGLFTLLLALVLGLLIYPAFAIFTTQQSEAYALVPMVAKLDGLMAEYGPEAARGRPGLIAALERARVRFFGDHKRGPRTFTYLETRTTAVGVEAYFASLEPATERQRRLLDMSRSLAEQIADAQMLMARQLHNPLPNFLLVIVVAWAAALFFGNGLIAKVNMVVVGADFAGAAAIGSAIFLIAELSNPYTGFIRLDPAGLDGLIALMKAEEEQASS